MPSEGAASCADAGELERRLIQLAEKFPRYKRSFAKLRAHVSAEEKNGDWKCQAVRGCLSELPTAIEDIIEETHLGRQSIEQALVSLEAKGEAAKCNHLGDAVRIRKDGKPAAKLYWRRLERPRPSTPSRRDGGFVKRW
jgi:hypothetical protein